MRTVPKLFHIISMAAADYAISITACYDGTDLRGVISIRHLSYLWRSIVKAHAAFVGEAMPLHVASLSTMTLAGLYTK